ncbi:Ig-like domain-containing protein [Spirosoma gilvum]
MTSSTRLWLYAGFLLFVLIGTGSSTACLAQDGIYYAVKLLPDKVTYQVSLTSTVSLSGANRMTNSGQVTIVTPTNSFTVTNVQSSNGIWSNNTTVRHPAQNPGYDYFIFGLTPSVPMIPYSSTQEVILFTFTNSGACSGPIELWASNDPFQPNPPTQPINVGNDLTALGFVANGMLYNAWKGNYAVGSANCATLPTIAIVSPVTNTTVTTTTVAVSGTATAGASVTISEGGTQLCTTTAAQNGAWACTISFADGLHTLVGRASNTAGLSDPSTTMFTVNNNCQPKCVPIVITVVRRKR